MSEFRIFTTVSLILCMIYLLPFIKKSVDHSTVPLHLPQKDNHMNRPGMLGDKKIHIVVVSDKNKMQRYQRHSETVLCYAYRHRYQFSLIDPNQYYTCSTMTNFFFQKHCAVMLYLIQNPDVLWLLVLDGDTFVVNATKSLESFIPGDPNIHVIHYERFSYNEIMAGNYIIKNHPWSLLYLNKWVEFFRKLPNVPYDNNDNGVLHLHFLDMVGKLDDFTYRTCMTLYNNSFNESLYLKYVACTKCALKGQRKFLHIILHRKGHSFCRDFTTPEKKIHQFDLMVHGFKEDINQFFEEPVNSSSCIDAPNWTPKIHQSLILPDLRAAQTYIRQWEESASRMYPQTVAFPEIADCWPNCEPEITGAKLQYYTSIICDQEKRFVI